MSVIKFIATVLMALFIFFLTGEILSRSIKLDTTMIKPLLRDMPLHPDSYQPSSNVQLLYELKPGEEHVYNQVSSGQIVKTNAFGFRDPPRSKEKSPRCLRIVCLGASTVYGHFVNNDETYPHYLEQILTERLHKSNISVEVWNAGMAGMVCRQTVEIAKRVVDDYSPDVLIFLYTNIGKRSILANYPFDHFFREDPSLFWENLRFIPFCDRNFGCYAFNHSYFWRSLVIGANYIITVKTNNRLYDDDEPNMTAFLDFCEKYSKQIPIFVFPWHMMLEKIPRLGSTGAIAFNLFETKNLPPQCTSQYFDIHPTANVYRWYAEILADELESAGVLRLRKVDQSPKRNRFN